RVWARQTNRYFRLTRVANVKRRSEIEFGTRLRHVDKVSNHLVRGDVIARSIPRQRHTGTISGAHVHRANERRSFVIILESHRNHDIVDGESNFLENGMNDDVMFLTR